MIETLENTLTVRFPDVHPEARLTFEFVRTFRIPDDGKIYPLPPGLGRFPLRHIDDFQNHVPDSWIEHGGVMLPMYQSEALWIKFHSAYVDMHEAAYPFAVQVAAGKINAVTGKAWVNGLERVPQNYLVIPTQPWLDGFCVEKGYIRQFVAMPLGEGYTAEEQITGEAQHGGLQISVCPMKREVFEERFPKIDYFELVPPMMCAHDDMGLAPGGRMHQPIYKDPFLFDDWDRDHRSRCFVHLVNSLKWRKITGKPVPHPPMTDKDYAQSGLPWFEYYDETSQALPGSEILKDLKSVFTMGTEKTNPLFIDDESVTPQIIQQLNSMRSVRPVREGCNEP